MAIKRKIYIGSFGNDGATVLELSLILPVFFLIILFIYDITRYLVVQALLIKGAQDGLNVAKALDGIDVDTRQVAFGSFAAFGNAANIARYNTALQRVISEASRIPANTILHQSNGNGINTKNGGQQLLNWEVDPSNPAAGIAAPAGTFMDAILIRPGEKFRYFPKTGTPITISHPTCVDAATCGDLWFVGPDSYIQLLRRQPLEVVTMARFNFFLPFLGATTVTGRAMGFRERYNRPGGAGAESPPPTPTPTPVGGGTPTQTPTSTPLGTPTPPYTCTGAGDECPLPQPFDCGGGRIIQTGVIGGPSCSCIDNCNVG